MAQSARADEHLGSTTFKRPMRPIDLVHLARQCLGDEGLEQEILRLFDTTALTYFQRLQLATTHEDIAMNLHALKGASSGVGAWTIADLAKVAELTLQADGQVSPEALADLSIAVEEVRGFIARVLATDPA